MSDMLRTVNLWLAWYRDVTEKEDPRRALRLKMLYASSQEEAQVEIQQWLEEKGLLERDLERLEPSPYGLQFARK